MASNRLTQKHERITWVFAKAGLDGSCVSTMGTLGGGGSGGQLFFEQQIKLQLLVLISSCVSQGGHSSYSRPSQIPETLPAMPLSSTFINQFSPTRPLKMTSFL